MEYVHYSISNEGTRFFNLQHHQILLGTPQNFAPNFNYEAGGLLKVTTRGLKDCQPTNLSKKVPKNCQPGDSKIINQVGFMGHLFKEFRPLISLISLDSNIWSYRFLLQHLNSFISIRLGFFYELLAIS